MRRRRRRLTLAQLTSILLLLLMLVSVMHTVIRVRAVQPTEAPTAALFIDAPQRSGGV